MRTPSDTVTTSTLGLFPAEDAVEVPAVPNVRARAKHSNVDFIRVTRSSGEEIPCSQISGGNPSGTPRNLVSSTPDKHVKTSLDLQPSILRK